MADDKSCGGKVIGGKRYCGKTTELIKKASEEQLYILCANETMARIIFKQAQDMELQIPFPITVGELPLAGYMKEILIDEVEIVLQHIIGKRVAGMSTSYEMKELPSLREKVDEIGEVNEKNGLHIANTLKGLKAIQREAKKATAALKELEEQKKDKYLVIELDKLGEVPKVIHEGKEITLKEFINFQWNVRTDKPGNTDVIVDYFDKDNGLLKRKSIREGVYS